MIFVTMHQTRLLVDANDHVLGVVVVARVGPIGIVLVLGGTLEIEQGLALAAQLIGPLAALDTIIVE